MALNSNISNYTNNMNTSDVIDLTELFGPQRDPLYIVLTTTIMLSFIFISGLYGNILTCIVIIQNKDMHNPTNYYLFNLAISDLLLLVSGVPQDIYSIWSKWPYIFGNVFCVLRILALETSRIASILTIILFTKERYIAICHPFMSHQMSKSRALKRILILWMVSLGLALPQALQFGITVNRGVAICSQTRVIVEYSIEIFTFLLFVIPMVLITVIYSLIGLELYRSNKGLVSAKDNQLKRNSIDLLAVHNKKNRTQSTKRVINMLVAVVIAFFICWAPFHVQRLIEIYSKTENHPIYLFMTYISGLYYLSTCINPIVYYMMSSKFKDAYKTIPLRKKNLKYIMNVSSSRDENLCQQCKRTFASFTKGDGRWSCTHELHATLPDRNVKRSPESSKNLDSDTFNT